MKFGKRNILIFMALFWSSLTLLFDCFTIVPAGRSLLATRFPATQGTILSSDVIEKGDGDGNIKRDVRIAYTYSVGGREYTGNRWSYNKWNFGCCWADDVVKAHPPGSQTRVFYNPGNPQDSVLTVGIHGNDLFMAVFMTPFNLAMIFLWRESLIIFFRRWTKPLVPGLKIIVEPRRLRVRMCQFSFIGATLAGIGVLAFLSIFIMALAYGGNPPFFPMLIDWGIILLGGIIYGVWHGVKVMHGSYDLLIDELNGWMELPRFAKRKERLRVPLKNIDDVRVDVTTFPTSDDDSSPKYTPTIVLTGEPQKTEPLTQWMDEEKAYAFAKWLREQLPHPSPIARPTSAGIAKNV